MAAKVTSSTGPDMTTVDTLVVSGKGGTIHRVFMVRGVMRATERCNLDVTDEESPYPGEVENAEPERFCRWCFPRGPREGDDE